MADGILNSDIWTHQLSKEEMTVKLRKRGLPVVASAVARRNRLLENINLPLIVDQAKSVVGNLIPSPNEADVDPRQNVQDNVSENPIDVNVQIPIGSPVSSNYLTTMDEVMSNHVSF